MRSSRLLLLAAFALLAFAAATRARADGVTLAGHPTVRTNAPSHAPSGTMNTSAGIESPWLNIGPNRLPGRFHGVYSDILNLPMIGCASDGVGYWWGYALSDAGWEERGKEAGGGTRQMISRLDFPSGGGYFQPVTVIRNDGSIWYTPDDGVNWLPSTIFIDPSYHLAGARQLGFDSGSINVAFALVYGTDPDGEDGVAILRSFDGGQSFDFTRFVPTQRASLWCSRQGSGDLFLAYTDVYGEVVVERNVMLADPSWWSVTGNVVPPNGNPAEDSVYVVAQENTPADSVHVWVVATGGLYRSADGGANFEFVREFTPNGDRCLQTSLVHPELMMWTVENDGAYWSTDGGATAHRIPAETFNPNGYVHNAVSEVDVYKWNFGPPGEFTVRRKAAEGAAGWTSEKRTLPAGAVKIDRRVAAASDPGDFEHFYLSTGGGVYRWSLEDTVCTRLTNDGVLTLQVNDVTPLRDAQLHYSTLLATRHQGVLHIQEWGPSVPGDINWTTAVTSFPLDIGHVVTSYRPLQDDPVYFADFRYGGVTAVGNGVFSGVGFALGGFYHAAMVADPVGPYRFWIADTYLHRLTWNRAANTWADDAIPSPSDIYGQRGIGFAVAPSNLSRMYYETEDGRVFYTPNAGAAWFEGAVGPGLGGSGPLPNDPGTYHYVNVTVNPANPLDAWIVGTSVIHTTDGGANWTTVTAGLPANPHAWELAYDGTPAASLFLASDAGPFRWNPATSQWDDLAPAGGIVPNVPFRSVAAAPWQAVMRWGTWGRGVWDYNTYYTLAAPAPQGPSLALAASRNPVRDLARLDYTLPLPGRVRLELIDVAGRRVATLRDGLEGAGEGSATLDVRGMGPGVYFARLVTEQGERSTRIVVAH